MNRLSSPQTAYQDEHDDWLFYDFVCLLYKLDLAAVGDTVHAYQWLVGDA